MLCFLFILFIFTPAAKAAEFDILLQSEIDARGVRSDNDGIIYASAAEHGTMLTIISVEKKNIIINLYGSENEPADKLSVPLGRRSFSIGITAPSDSLCIGIQYAGRSEYYRPVNDALTLSEAPCRQLIEIAVWKNGTLRTIPNPISVYNTVNELKLSRADSLPLTSVELDSNDKEEILNLLRACADIAEYDSRSYDIDELTRRVLYTHRNFTALTSLSAKSSEANPDLKFCSYDFIADAMRRAFRIEPKKPPVNMISELKYCFNNGNLYYTGGYSGYFLTTVGDIIRSYETGENTLYIIFSDTFTDAEHTPFPEYSTAEITRDPDGFYISSLRMGGDLNDLYESLQPEPEPDPGIFRYILPALIALAALAAIGIVIQLFLIHPR